MAKSSNSKKIKKGIVKKSEKQSKKLKFRNDHCSLLALVDNLPGMAYCCRNDKNWTMQFISKGCFELTGYKSDDLINNKKITYAQLIHPDDRKMVWQKVQSALKKKQPFKFVYRIKTAKGKEKWVWEQGEGIFHAKANKLVLEGFITDITKYKATEEVLKQQVSFVEHNPAPVLQIKYDGIIINYNLTAKKIFKNKIINKSIYSIFSELNQSVFRNLKTNKQFQFEQKLNDKIFLFTVIKDASTKSIYIYGSNITRRQEARKALQESEKKYRTLVQNLNIGVYRITSDVRGSFLQANPAIAKMFGYDSAEEFMKVNVIDLYQNSKDRKSLLKKICKKGFAKDEELKLRKKDGTPIIASCTTKLQLDKKGKGQWLDGILEDITERKEAAIALESSEEKYRSMIDQSMVGVLMLDRTKIIFANQKVSDIFGYKNVEKVLNKDIKKFLIPESYKIAKQRIYERFAGKPVLELGEYVGIKKDKRKIHIQTFSKIVLIGKKSYSLVLVIDITKQKLTEESLAKRMQELKVLYRVNAHTLIINPIRKVLCDISKDIILGCRFPKIAHAKIIFDNKEYTYTNDVPNFLFKIEESIVVRGIKRGKIILGYFATLPQMNSTPFLSEERKLLKAVTHTLSKHITSREVVERYEKLIKKSAAGIFISQKDILHYINPKFCKIFRVKEKEATGMSISKLILNYKCDKKIQISNGSMVRCVTKGKRSNGNIIDLEIIAQKIDYHGQEGILGWVQDITKLKRAEERLQNFNIELKSAIAEKTRHLEKANKRLHSLNELKDEFIAVTSHELRSPLTAIRGYLSFLTEKELINQLPDTVQQYLMRAYNNVETLNYLINNILDVSRLDTGQIFLQKLPTDLFAILQNTIENLAFQASEKKIGIKIKNKTKRKKIVISADSIRIRQVIRNILDNAIKFSRRSKTVWIEISQKQNIIFIKIIDQGIGIPKAQISQIFDKFIQAKNADARYKGGAGLGLFIAKKIVELHNGKINVVSQKDKGTTFTIQLPIL